MRRLLVDAGTTWSKVLEICDDDSGLADSPMASYEPYKIKSDSQFVNEEGKVLYGRIFLFPSSLMSKSGLIFDKATGHMVKKHVKTDGVYENEIISLAYGAKKLLNSPENATIVDLGSRDIKWIKFKNGKYKDLDWNGNCGSATGATVEMLCKFYNIDPSKISIEKDKIPVTCGVFAMEKIMDLIASDTPVEVAISRYIHGIAYNTWNFAGRPDKIHLSGGFCLNKCFVESLKLYAEVETLGRFVLLEGLY